MVFLEIINLSDLDLLEKKVNEILYGIVYVAVRTPRLKPSVLELVLYCVHGWLVLLMSPILSHYSFINLSKST